MDDASTSGESELIVDGEVNQEREERDSDARRTATQRV